MSFNELGKNQLKEIKEKYRVLNLDEEEEEEAKNIKKVFRKATKNCIDWATLFVYCYEQLILIRHSDIQKRLKNFNEIFGELDTNLQEYNRPVDFGKNNYYNKLKIVINNNLNDVRELINFTFTKILAEGEGYDASY